MENKKYHIPEKYKKAESENLQADRDSMYEEMDNTIDLETGLILQQLYDYKADEYYTAIHRTASSKEDIFKKGIYFGKGNFPSTDFDDHIQVVQNFPFMLREIKYCNDYKYSTGCFIVKIPKRNIRSRYVDEKTEPIYYRAEDGKVYIRPEFISAYVPVRNEELQPVEFNTEPHNIYNSDTTYYLDENIANNEDVKKMF